MATQDRSENRAEKRRYVTLDGLRGVAAVMVVLFHTGDRIGTWTPRFGYLAVDLFFLLSGFVLAYRYESRFSSGLGASEFLIARIVRLYPLYVLGLVFGASLALFNMDLPSLTPQGDAISFGLGLVALPSYVLPHGQFLFAVNPPLWSLFYEFWVANIMFVILRNRLDWRLLLMIILGCGVGMLIGEKVFYNLNIGPSWPGFAGGFARLGFSFFFGVAIARMSAVRPARIKLPSWLFLLAVPALLSLPLRGAMAHRYELLCVFVLFPAMVYWGAEAFERRPRFGAALGDASYAMYTIHYPLWIVGSWALYALAIRPSLAMQFLFVGLVTTLAWGLSHVDTRVRSILMSRLRSSRAARGEVATVNAT